MDKSVDKRSFMHVLAVVAAVVLMIVAMGVSAHAVDTSLLPDGVYYTTVDEEGNAEDKHLSREQFDIIGIDTGKDNITLKGPSSGAGKWYVVYGGGTILHRIEVDGIVNLLLMNETELDCKEGFHVRRGNNYVDTLNIYAQGADPASWGKLIATGGAGQAAIGANKTVDIVELGGGISIYGGIINVTGGAYAAGIGGGRGVIPASGKRYGGDGGIFNLYGGLVTATGGVAGAGIGGGFVGNSGTINIYGGTLEARSESGGSGIGGGENMEIAAYIENGGSAENITIKGGNVRAYGGFGAAGIGGGMAADGSAGGSSDREADKKWIKVEGGDVYAEGGEGGAGIGGGIYRSGDFYDHGAGANVMLTGGRVTARGGAEAAGIGATRCRLQGSGDTIIKGTAKVTAYGGDYAAGIGTGNEPMAMALNAKWNKIYNIDISENAEVRAFGGKEAAGIGAGNEGQPSATAAGMLKISGNARVEAYGGKYGAGIGGGDQNNCGSAVISGGTVNAYGGEYGAGIGSGDKAGGRGGKITIRGGVVNANGGYKAAGIGAGDTADMKCELEVTGGKVTAKAGENGAGIGGGNHTFWSGGGNGGNVKVDLADSSADAEDFVFAISGSDDSSPIGHGDAGDGLGNLTIGERMSVKATAGGNYDKYDTVNAIKPETYTNRVNVSHNAGTMSVLIQYCKHKEAKYTYLDEQKHRVRCPSCGLDDEEAHTPSDQEPCTKCNFDGEVWVVTLKEGIDGNYDSTLKVAKTQSTHLPDCEADHVPDGREFVGWVTTEHNVNSYDFDELTSEQVAAVKSAISAAKKAGSEITPTADITYYALYIPEATVSFDPGEGSGTMSMLKAPLFSTVKLPKSTFTPPEYKEFDKWTIDGSDFEAGEDYSVEQASVQLTATWKEHTHDFDYEGGHVAAVVPGCLEPGNVEFYKCKTCGRYFADDEGTTEIAESDIDLSPTGHNWDAVTYTWSEDNSEVTAKQVCLNNTEHHREETASTVSHVETEASCSKEGVTHYYAQFENPVFKMQSKTVKTPKTAHDWNDWQVDPDDANKEIRTCKVCSAKEEREVGHTHTMKHNPAEQPQCEKQGKKEYYECTTCGKLYADEEGNQEITDAGSLGIPAIGHKYVVSSSEVVKLATCDENGVLRVTKTCEHDSSHKITEYPDIPALGHNWNSGTVTKAATCTEDGTKEYVCLRDPEHTKTEKIAARGHEWSEWTSVTEDGVKYKQRECTRCGKTQRIADGDTECEHEAETIQGTPATCTEGGIKDHYECSKCRVYLKKNDDGTYSPVTEDQIEKYLDDLIINRLGHSWDEPEYTWSEDNSSVTATLTCKRDAEHKETETVKATSEVTKTPTCEEEGETIYTAEFENNFFEKQTKVVHEDAKGHTWDSGKVIKPATTKAAGKKEYTCKVCGEKKTVSIPKLKPAEKTDNVLLSKMKTKGSNGLVLTWSKVKGAKGYDIFFIKCGKKPPKKVKTIKGNKTFKWIKLGLKKKKPYKAIVKAFVTKNGKKTYIKSSLLVHAYTSGGTKNFTNAKKVTVKKTKVSLKTGKTYKIKAKVIKLKKSKKLMPTYHAAKLRYVTSNKKVATVSKSGKITAKSKGTCYVYVCAHSGISKKVKVTVK